MACLVEQKDAKWATFPKYKLKLNLKQHGTRLTFILIQVEYKKSELFYSFWSMMEYFFEFKEY